MPVLLGSVFAVTKGAVYFHDVLCSSVPVGIGCCVYDVVMFLASLGRGNHHSGIAVVINVLVNSVHVS